MDGYAFTLADAALVALPSGALFWPERGLLTVADLHLGRAQRPARFGGAALPPYEIAETLARLDADLDATGARRVVALGDSFDDPGAEARMDETHRFWLARMMAGRDWTWIAGNHDPGPVEIGGSHLASLALAPLTFVHICTPAGTAEVSGHYHPKARLGPGPAAPCFLIDRCRVILPAYGRYTGGLRSDAPELASLMQPGALAVLTGRRARAIPFR
ncbi:MAG: ligase-associated DNA damage response endonuclease PdeM [Gemmobacter sp.]